MGKVHSEDELRREDPLLPHVVGNNANVAAFCLGDLEGNPLHLALDFWVSELAPNKQLQVADGVRDISRILA